MAELVPPGIPDPGILVADDSILPGAGAGIGGHITFFRSEIVFKMLRRSDGDFGTIKVLPLARRNFRWFLVLIRVAPASLRRRWRRSSGLPWACG